MNSSATVSVTIAPANRAPASASSLVSTREYYLKSADAALNNFLKKSRSRYISVYRDGLKATSRGDKARSDALTDVLVKEQDAIVMAKRMRRIYLEFSARTNNFNRLTLENLTYATLERLIAYVFHINALMQEHRNTLSDLSVVHNFVNAFMNDHVTTFRIKAAERLVSDSQGIAPMLVRLAVKGLQLSTDLLCVSDTDTATKLPGNEQIDTLPALGLSYECAICNSILNEPIALTACSHLTCRSCADRTCIARNSPNYTCAQCRAVTPNVMACNTNNAVMRAISNFKIRCPLGCGKVLTIGTDRREIVQHIYTECNKAGFTCPGCDQTLPSGLGEAAYIKHANRECSKRLVLCCGCGEEMPYDEMIQHLLPRRKPDFLGVTFYSLTSERDAGKNANGRRPAPSNSSLSERPAAGPAHADSSAAADADREEAQNKRARGAEESSTEEEAVPEITQWLCKNQFPCPNHAKGCDFILNDSTEPIELHQEHCQFRSLPCKNAHNGCTTLVLPLETDIHEEVCLYAQLTCQFCGETYLRGKASEHFVASDGAVVAPFSQQCVNQTKCQNPGCEEYIAFFSASGVQHRAECRHRYIRCDVCHESFPFHEKAEHDRAKVHFHDLIITAKTTKEEVQTLKEQVKMLQDMNRALKTEIATNRTALDVHTASIMRTMRIISRPEHTAAAAVAAGGFSTSMSASTTDAAANGEDPEANRRALIASICESDIFASEQRHSVMNRIGLFFSLNAFPAHYLTDLMETIAEAHPPPVTGVYPSMTQPCLKVPAETAFTHAATGLRIHPIFVFGREYAHMEMKIDMAPGYPTHPAIDDYEIEFAYSMMRRCAKGRCPITIQNTVPKKCVVTPARLPVYNESAWRTFNRSEYTRPNALATADIFTLSDVRSDHYRCAIRLQGATIEADPIFKSDVGALVDWHKRDAPTRTQPSDTRKREFLLIAVRILSIRKLGEPRADAASTSAAASTAAASSATVRNSMETDDEGIEMDEF